MITTNQTSEIDRIVAMLRALSTLGPRAKIGIDRPRLDYNPASRSRRARQMCFRIARAMKIKAKS